MMKKLDLSQVISILANIGVIAGIVFLAIEVRQNNELLRSEARASRAATSQGFFLPLIQSSRLAEALDEELGGDGSIDELMLTFYYQYILVGWEYSFGEVRSGALDESALPVNGWRGALGLLPGLEAHYESRRETLSPDFVEFFDSRVLRTESRQRP